MGPICSWLIRGPDRPTIVDIVTERVLAYVGQSPLAAHLSPTPESAVEFMVSAIYAELLAGTPPRTPNCPITSPTPSASKISAPDPH